jgi:hypothetical protein
MTLIAGFQVPITDRSSAHNANPLASAPFVPAASRMTLSSA